MKTQGGEQLTVFEADARAAMMRACGHCASLLVTMTEAASGLQAAKLTDIERQLQKALEFQRLSARRVAAILEQLEKRAAP